MALVRCPHHQLQGMVLVCSHIVKSVEDKTKIEKIISLDLVANDSIDPFESMESTAFYCLVCAKQYDFPTENSQKPESEYENVVGKMGEAICIKCFKETYNIE